MKVFLNGKIIPAEKAVVSVNDRGFQVGDGVYETIRVYAGVPFLVEDHLRRLWNSMRGVAIRIPYSPSSLKRAVERTVRANSFKEATVRVTVTRGPGPRGFDPRFCKTPTVLIQVVPFHAYAPRLYTRGMTIALARTRRNSPASIPPSVKTTSCHNNILAKIEANKAGADEAVLLGQDGTLAEGTISNIFIVKNRAVITPPLDGRLLSGVTRLHVLKLAKRLGFRVREAKITPAALRVADEAFLTSTLMEIMPIGRVIDLNDRRPAVWRYPAPRVTAQLMKCYTPARLKNH